MGRRVIDGPDRSRLLIDVPTRILMDCRSKDITPSLPSSTCLPPSPASSLMRLVLRVPVPFVPLEVVAVIVPCLTMFKLALLVERRSGGR